MSVRFRPPAPYPLPRFSCSEISCFWWWFLVVYFKVDYSEEDKSWPMMERKWRNRPGCSGRRWTCFCSGVQMVKKTGRSRYLEGASQKDTPHSVGRAKRQPSSWAFFTIWIYEGGRGPRKKGSDRTHRPFPSSLIFWHSLVPFWDYLFHFLPLLSHSPPWLWWSRFSMIVWSTTSPQIKHRQLKKGPFGLKNSSWIIIPLHRLHFTLSSLKLSHVKSWGLE